MKAHRWELLAAAITLIAFVVQLSVPLNWDAAWLAYLAREANEGVQVYREYIEINPPLQLWLLRPVVATANLVGLPVASMVKWFLFCVAGALTWHVGFGASSRLREQVLWGVALGALLLPMDQFGQRDHFSALLILPSAVVVGQRRAGDEVGRRRAALAGLLAGVAVALKPHYAVVLPLVAIYGLWGSESKWGSLVRQSEIWLPVMLFGAYLLSIAALAPEYFDQAHTYGAYYLEWHRARLHDWLQPLTFMTIAVCLGWGVARRGHPFRVGGDALLLTTVGLFIGAVIQDKGFSYHLLPAAIAASAILPLIVSSRRHVVTALVASVTLIAIYQGQRWAASAEARVASISATLRSTRARSVLVATHMVRTAWPAVLMENVRWSSSFPSTWWMARLMEKRSGATESKLGLDLVELAPIEQLLLGRFAEDLERRRPDLVIAYMPDSRVEAYRVGIMKVLTLEPRATSALADYEWLPTGDTSLCLYVRKDLATALQRDEVGTVHQESRCEQHHAQAALLN